jgi:putative ABC transport system substrate-binding protein
MLTSGYPVESGLADSLARPGKNVTGNAIYAGTEIWAKLVQLLLEARPSTRRVGVLWNYVPPAFPEEEIGPCYAELRKAERSLDVKIHIVESAKSEEVPAALAKIQAEQPDALLPTSSGVPANMRSTIMQFAVDKRLPTITDLLWQTGVGPYPPLLSYGAAWPDLMRNAAVYADMIMKGAKPGELPIQRPAKFSMTLNLRTAKAIGLTVPPPAITALSQPLRETGPAAG